MALETGTYIGDLVPSNPVGATDPKSQGDDHLRLIKNTLQNTFPNADKEFYFPRYVALTGDTSLTAAHANALIGVDSSAGAVTLTLPSLAQEDSGWAIDVVKVDDSTEAVVLGGSVNGVTNYSVAAQYEHVRVMWTGAVFLAVGLRDLYNVISKTDDATLTREEMRSLVLVAAAADAVLTLPAGAIGDWIRIKNLTSNLVTITPDGTETIDGDPTLVLSRADEAVFLVHDGTDWEILNHYASNPPAHPTTKVVGLVIKNTTAAPNVSMDVDCEEVVLADDDGNTVKFLDVDVSVNTAFSGVNGIDVSTVAGGQQYYIWLISNGTTIAGILHRLDLDPPTMPTGYTYKKLVGWCRTDASANLMRIRQVQDTAVYVVGTNPSAPEIIENGAVGNTGVNAALGTYQLAGKVPANAKSVFLLVTNTWKNNGPHTTIVAGGADYDGTNRGATGSAGVIYPVYLDASARQNVGVELLLDDLLNIYYAGNGTGSAVALQGWRVPL